MRVTELTGCTDEYSIEATINGRIEHLEDDYDVRVINIKVTKGGASEFHTYSVWVELRERRNGGSNNSNAREDFMRIVYNELSDDSDNCRANRIIDAADEYVEEVMGLERESNDD